MASNNQIADALDTLAEAADSDIAQHDLNNLAESLRELGDGQYDKFWYAPGSKKRHGPGADEARFINPDDDLRRGWVVPTAVADGEPRKWAYRVAGERCGTQENEAGRVRAAYYDAE